MKARPSRLWFAQLVTKDTAAKPAIVMDLKKAGNLAESYEKVTGLTIKTMICVKFMKETRMCDDGLSWANESYEVVKKWMQELKTIEDAAVDKEYLDVPINSANIISDAYNKDQVIILCYDRCNNKVSVTTYGKSVPDSYHAALSGNRIKKYLNWPDKLCHAESERVLTVKAAMKRFKAIVEGLDCACEDGYTCTVHSDLKLADEALMALMET
jgi:hypothetical protein